MPVTKQLSRHRQLSIMLMLVTFAFVLLTLPSCIYFVFFRHLMPTGKSFRTYRYMVQICLGSVQFTAHAINFFLYCFSTKNFRNELRDFIHEIVYCSMESTGHKMMMNSSTENAKRKYFLSKRYRNQESTLENQQTGQQFALKDMQTILINDG
jgi:hypothetical protein